MAFRIERPATAFSTSPSKGRKRPRVEEKAHLAWVRTLGCVITGKRPVHAAHIRYADPIHGKPETGMGTKADDCWVVPLSAELHTDGPGAQHRTNEREWWASRGIDPCAIALALWRASGDDEAAELILRAARAKARLPRPTNEA